MWRGGRRLRAALMKQIKETLEGWRWGLMVAFDVSLTSTNQRGSCCSSIRGLATVEPENWVLIKETPEKRRKPPWMFLQDWLRWSGRHPSDSQKSEVLIGPLCSHTLQISAAAMIFIFKVQEKKKKRIVYIYCECSHFLVETKTEKVILKKERKQTIFESWWCSKAWCLLFNAVNAWEDSLWVH